jgi:hypothetical protein
MKGTSALTLTFLGLFLAFLQTGCVEKQVAYPSPSAAGPGVATVVTRAPPRPNIEVVGRSPDPNYVWAPGAWEWHGRWVWVSGKWALRPHPNATWAPGHWTQRDYGWVWIHGYWR